MIGLYFEPDLSVFMPANDTQSVKQTATRVPPAASPPPPPPPVAPIPPKPVVTAPVAGTVSPPKPPDIPRVTAPPPLPPKPAGVPPATNSITGFKQPDAPKPSASPVNTDALINSLIEQTAQARSDAKNPLPASPPPPPVSPPRPSIDVKVVPAPGPPKANQKGGFKPLMFGLAALFILASIPLGVFIVQNRQRNEDIRSRAAGSCSGSTNYNPGCAACASYTSSATCQSYCGCSWQTATDTTTVAPTKPASAFDPKQCSGYTDWAPDHAICGTCNGVSLTGTWVGEASAPVQNCCLKTLNLPDNSTHTYTCGTGSNCPDYQWHFPVDNPTVCLNTNTSERTATYNSPDRCPNNPPPPCTSNPPGGGTPPTVKVPNCSNVQGPSMLTVGSPGTYTAVFAQLNFTDGSIFYASIIDNVMHDIVWPRPAPDNSMRIVETWTPTTAGTFNVCCRAWNDSVAECRPQQYVDGPPRFTCAGPNDCITVQVYNPSPTPTKIVNSPTPTLTPTPTTIVGQCNQMKVYKDSQQVADLSTLKPGDQVTIAVIGTNATQARIRVNGAAWTNTTATNASGEYYVPFTVPLGVYNFVIESEVMVNGVWK
jgi:hypothetical protein